MVKNPRMELKNAKPDAVMVTVVEEIPGDWEVIAENEDYGASGGLGVWEEDCRRAKFPGAARPGGYVRNGFRV